MYSRVNYTIVGVFVVFFTIGMIWFAFWLGKYGLHDEYDTYRTEMTESVAGLSKDSNVKLNGVDVGRVSDIRINPENIEVIEITLEIKKGVPIKEDMRASTQMLGVTGLLSIEIDGGTNSAKTLVPTDDYIPLIKSRSSLLSKLTSNLDGMGNKLARLLVQSEKLFSDKNIETFSMILENVEKVTKKGEIVEDRAIEALQEANATLRSFRESMSNMNQRFTALTQDFAEIKEVGVPTINKLMETTKNFNRVTLKVEQSLDRGDYNLRKILEPVIIDMQILSRELGSMSREFEQNPSGLLFNSRDPRRGPGE